MAFGAHNNICLVPGHVFQNHANSVGVDFHTGINKSNKIASASGHTVADGVPFAFVLRVKDYFYLSALEAAGFFKALVNQAVDDTDYFPFKSCLFQSFFYLRKILKDGFFLAKNGNNDA